MTGRSPRCGSSDELTSEITMLSEVIADLLAGDRGYQVIQQCPASARCSTAVIIAEIGDVHRFASAARLCSWARLTPAPPRVRCQGHARACHHAGLADAALSADRGRPARAPRSVIGAVKEAIIARRGNASPQHRQGRRRPAAAHPGLLRPAGRADPLLAPVSRRGPGRMSGSRPAARREVAGLSAPPPPGGAGALLDWPRLTAAPDADPPHAARPRPGPAKG